jgi:raffinose/stachyose/melibiose transport system substrate-binding protein
MEKCASSYATQNKEDVKEDNMYKRLIALAMCFLMLVGVAGCAQSAETTTDTSETVETNTSAEETASEATNNDEKITINVTSWFDTASLGDIYYDAWQQAADELGYEVIVDAMDSESFKTKEAVLMASGELPDVMTEWSTLYHLEPLISAGLIIPLDETMDNSGLTFLDAQKRPYYADGQCYIMPVTTGNSFFIYYNKELVSELGLPLPETLADMEEIVSICDAAGYDAFGLGIKDRWLADFTFMALVSREDPQAIDKISSGEYTWESEPFLKAAQTAQHLVEIGAFPDDCLNITVPEMREMFLAGRCPFLIEGGWRWTILYEQMGDNMGYIRFPMTGSDTDYTKTNMSNAPFGLVISSATEHPDEAKALCVKYCDIVSDYRAGNGLMNFVDKDSPDDVVISEEYQKLLDDTAMVENVVPAWSDDFEGSVLQTSYDLSQALFGGLITAEEFVELYQDNAG